MDFTIGTDVLALHRAHRDELMRRHEGRRDPGARSIAMAARAAARRIRGRR